MIRYLRAFWVALMMTLRGQTPGRSHQRLWEWIEGAVPLTQAVNVVAEKNNLTKAQRQQITLKLDGRETSMQTILSAIKHHLTEEYPYLLMNLTEHSITAIYASNMNDQYFMTRLKDTDALQQYPAVQQALNQLSDHLNSIPPSTEI